MARVCSASLLLCATLGAQVEPQRGDPWTEFEGLAGPGKGKHVVLVAADDEYRSEESMPQLAKILAARHGFRCTVLFAVDPESGVIDPSTKDNVPGLEVLEGADLLVLFARFRALPRAQMRHVLAYLDAGRPLVGLRTSTHAFRYPRDHPLSEWSFDAADGGFGRRVLGETWVAHYGRHGKESTRGVPADGMAGHPLLRGVDDVWGPSDVYAIRSLSGDSRPVLLGQVLTGMDPDDPPRDDRELVPIAWTRSYRGERDKVSRVFATTMGHAGDLASEGFRRLLVNACFWSLGLEKAIPERADVALVGDYAPSPIGIGRHKRGVRPVDHALAR